MGLTMKQWRLAKEFTQEEMALKCNVHRNTYASWEENPDSVSIGNAKVIALALGESVDTIFFNGLSTKRRTTKLRVKKVKFTNQKKNRGRSNEAEGRNCQSN